jgi:hypothetical protein
MRTALTAAVFLVIAAAAGPCGRDPGPGGADAGRDADDRLEAARRRTEVAAALAAAVADGRVDPADAVARVEALGRADPQWLAASRASLRAWGASDRAVAARVLLRHVEAVRAARGDRDRSAAAADQLAALAAEAGAANS